MKSTLPEHLPESSSAGDESRTAAGRFADLRYVQIATLQQIGDNLAAQTRRLEGLTAKVDDVRERLVRLEAQEAGKLVDDVRFELRAALVRIDDLEAERDKVAGVAAFWAWCAKSAPWLAAGLTAFLAGLGLKAGSR